LCALLPEIKWMMIYNFIRHPGSHKTLNSYTEKGEKQYKVQKNEQT